jgi:hypothetical protein
MWRQVVIVGLAWGDVRIDDLQHRVTVDGVLFFVYHRIDQRGSVLCNSLFNMQCQCVCVLQGHSMYTVVRACG